MRDFLLKMYEYMRRLPTEQGLHAAVAVALAMLEPDDRLAMGARLVGGGVSPDEAIDRLFEAGSDPAVAVGAAAALQLQSDGSVVVAPVSAAWAEREELPALLALAADRRLPVVFRWNAAGIFRTIWRRRPARTRSSAFRRTDRTRCG